MYLKSIRIIRKYFYELKIMGAKLKHLTGEFIVSIECLHSYVYYKTEYFYYIPFHKSILLTMNSKSFGFRKKQNVYLLEI